MKLVLFFLCLFCVSVVAQFLPLPPGRNGPPLPEKGYNIENLGKGLYAVSDWAYQYVVYLTSRNQFIVIDPPQSFITYDENGEIVSNKIETSLREISRKGRITHLIYSHSHADHTGSMGIMKKSKLTVKNVCIWASDQVAKRLAERNDPSRPLPTDVVSSEYKLKVNDAVVVLTVVPYHEPGSLKITFPRQRAAYFCDLIFQGWAPYKQLGFSYDIQAYAVALDDFLNTDIDTMICGHFTKVSPLEDVKLTRRYMVSLFTISLKYFQQQGALLGQAIQDSDFFNPVSSIYQNVYALIFPVGEQLEKSCGAEIVELWGETMAGIDLVAESHCLSVIEALTTDITPKFIERYAKGEKMYKEVLKSLDQNTKAKARYHIDD